MKENAAHEDAAAAEPESAAPSPIAFNRTAGLTESGKQLLKGIADAIRQQRTADAEGWMQPLAALAPNHPEVLRLRAVLAHVRGRLAEAEGLLKRGLAERPNDALAWNNFGSVLADQGKIDEAIVAFGRSAEFAPARAEPLFNLGRALDLTGRVDEAHDALVAALERDPAHESARVTLARVLQFMGKIGEAEAEYRRVLDARPDSALAWYGLSTLRTARFSASDVAAIERIYARQDLKSGERIGAGFALAKALEDQERYTEAFAVLAAANSAKRRRLKWDARGFSQYVDIVAAAFARPLPAAPAELGRDVVFVFGMPRSGSTLVEQILAAHPDVAGANELEDLNLVIEDEGKRRNKAFPDWVREMRAEDWQRLGNDYIERTAGLRGGKTVIVDKGLANWRYVGALRAMLPGAHLVNARRDPLENCLACFRQSFAKELGFTYDLAELASFWRDYDRTLRLWHQRFPNRIHDLVHENLIADPEAEIRRLLDFCGLPFDEACLRFHEVKRNVRTASAAQVREPLRADTARAARYGALLDPLRAMLHPNG